MTIKTFDANRVGGGTFSLVQDPTTGEYKLKEVGFVKLPPLKLPEIEQATVTTPTVTPSTPSTPEAAPASPAGGGEGGGEGGGQVDFTGSSQFENIQDEATKFSQSMQTMVDNQEAQERAAGINAGVSSEGTPLTTADVSSANQEAQELAAGIGPQKQFASQMIAERKASQMGPTSSNPRRPGASFANNQRSVPEASQALDDEYYGFDRPSNLGDFGRSMNQMSGSMPSNLGDTGRSMNRMSGSMPGQLGDVGKSMDTMSGAKSKNLVDTAKDVVSSVKSVSIADVIKKAASMSPTLSVIKAIGSVNEAANTENTTALRSGGYVTNFQGKIIGKDGKSVNAADSVFGGMNSRSAMGDISKGAQKRIDTISKTISKMTPAQLAKSSLPARKEKFEKELREHNNERVASREDKSGATGKNKGGFTNPGANSYGPHSGGGGNNGGGRGKIVCTMMNESYGFGSFRNKIWLRHSKNLAPEYQRGYHRLFLPLVKKAKTNKILKKILEHIAIHRTIDIRQEERNKIHLIGRIYRKILEPICYWAGKK